MQFCYKGSFIDVFHGISAFFKNISLTEPLLVADFLINKCGKKFLPKFSIGSLLKTTQSNPIVSPQFGVSSYNPSVMYMLHTMWCFHGYFFQNLVRLKGIFIFSFPQIYIKTKIKRDLQKNKFLFFINSPRV